MNEKYLAETPLLDYKHSSIQKLIKDNGWLQLNGYDRVGAAYNYVRNTIKFGYNSSDELKSSQVFADSYGQCNTKATLLMSLFRALGIPCRFHGFTIDKKLQKGAITGIFYRIVPKNIIHSWVEIYFENKWINLEGFILDEKYLSQLQNKFNNVEGSFSGYGVATDNFKNPPIKWQGKDTYIQKEGINNDLGVFNNPDDFYKKNGSNLSGIKKWLYANFIRKLMNLNVSKIRG
ncbi:MAG: transglutaminase family protein [Rhizobiales bacterium]|nr:transglutaminase family protein [Hyphomicrobiales bacterium]